MSSPWHACMPSSQVCSAFESPFSPQVRYQLPPRAQHVRSPASLVTHLEHVVAGAGVVAVAVDAASEMDMAASSFILPICLFSPVHIIGEFSELVVRRIGHKGICECAGT